MMLEVATDFVEGPLLAGSRLSATTVTDPEETFTVTTISVR
jgi:hypothetical protein